MRFTSVQISHHAGRCGQAGSVAP